MDLDLQQFASRDQTRWYLTKPFSMGEFSFATDGAILVRQPRRDDVPDIDAKAPKFSPGRVLDGLEDAQFYVPRFHLPPAPDGAVACPACDGRGLEHDCPGCECTCEKCWGCGEANAESNISTTIAGVAFALNYVRQMASLPGLEIANTTVVATRGGKPLLFRFDGGVGALMPLSAIKADHIDIEQPEGG